MPDNNRKNENMPGGSKGGGPKKPDDNFDWSKIIRMVFGWGAVIVAAVIVMQMVRTGQDNYVEIPFDAYENLLDNTDKIAEAKITKSDVNDYYFTSKLTSEATINIDGKPKKVTAISVYIPEPIIKDQEAIWRKKGIVYSFDKESSEWLNIIIGFLPWILIIAVWVIIMRRMQGQGGGSRGIFSFGKSKAKLITQSGQKVTFRDVAGADEAKLELQEVIEFLKEPSKFQKLGGKIPKGVLLLGPPGTGKTLLARAVAGEAGVPFFSISGADFVEMFVGVGASRVRDLFDQGKKNAPCIIFIDEIDAVGRHRGAGLGGGHDEREQTLNQILSEMDGFEQNESVVVMAATNRLDVLDAALTRPGRFDRRITLELPHKEAREKILEIHTRHVPLADNVDLENLAARTVSFSGADLKNLVNEAALLAGRKQKKKVDKADFDEARDKVLLGEKREEIITEEEKKVIAYHEAGYALIAKLLPGTDPLQKVTIIPRGCALGATEQIPEIERHNLNRQYLLDRIAVSLGGRAAEKIVFDEYTNGDESDLKVVKSIAKKMICQWGMSDRLGPVTFKVGEEHPFLGRELTEVKDFSEYTARIIDEEIQRIIQDMEQKSENILKANRIKLDALAEALLENETLEKTQINWILDKVSNNGSKEKNSKKEEVKSY